jgi:hypothetical protein
MGRERGKVGRWRRVKPLKVQPAIRLHKRWSSRNPYKGHLQGLRGRKGGRDYLTLSSGEFQKRIISQKKDDSSLANSGHTHKQREQGARGAPVDGLVDINRGQDRGDTGACDGKIASDKCKTAEFLKEALHGRRETSKNSFHLQSRHMSGKEPPSSREAT